MFVPRTSRSARRAGSEKILSFTRTRAGRSLILASIGTAHKGICLSQSNPLAPSVSSLLSNVGISDYLDLTMLKTVEQSEHV